MIVILVIAIVISNLLKVGLSSSGNYEGFEEGDEKPTSESADQVEAPEPDTENMNEPTKKDNTPTASSKNKKEKMAKNIIDEGKELLDLQEKIVSGFETIDPYMKKAEDLTKNIQKTAGIMNNLK